MQAWTIFCFFSVKLIEYFFSAFNVVSSNPCVGPLPRIKIYFLLSKCTEELISTPKIMQFLPNSLHTENFPFLSNPVPYPEYFYLSISSFLVSLTAPNKLCVKSVQIRSYFWSVFSCIWTECGYLWSKSPYSFRIQENTDQK